MTELESFIVSGINLLVKYGKTEDEICELLNRVIMEVKSSGR